MDYKVSISENNRYLIVRVFKDVTNELALRFSRDAAALGDEKGIRKLLVDERGWGSLSSVLQKHDFAHGEAEGTGLTRVWRVAILKDPEDRRDVDFLETVMRNAGFNFRLFTDESEAKRWLEA